MVFSNICLALVVIAVSCTLTDGALSWGTFLGADWRIGEENMRSDLAVYIKNTQRICAKDVEKLCSSGRYVNAQTRAYTEWSGQYQRHMHARWDDVPLGFGAAPDACLRNELTQYRTGVLKRMIPKCVEWMDKTEGQFAKLHAREGGNDRRERVVVFATVFATALSAIVGYMFGIFLRERDEAFAYHDRDDSRKTLAFFGVVMSIPVGVILWASPTLFMVMAGTCGIGRGAQYYVQKKKDAEYSGVPASDSGSVFAAIPVQMD